MHVHDVSDLSEEHPQALVDFIVNGFSPDTWEVVGGSGTIRADMSDAGTLLVVSQTLATQRRIQAFLGCLRVLKALPPDERSTVAGEGYWSVSDPAARARRALQAAVTHLVGTDPRARSFQSLVDLVQRTIQPHKWNAVGGSGSVHPITGDPACLVIRPTTAGHRAVDAFLRSLR